MSASKRALLDQLDRQCSECGAPVAPFDHLCAECRGTEDPGIIPGGIRARALALVKPFES
jgi:predicted amidophosphoribosyltransferase